LGADVRERQRIEAGRLARDERLVLATQSANEDLGAAILVDEERVSAAACTRWVCAAMKDRNTVLPDPVGPTTVKLPMSRT
jgi:hypothetical protein